MKSVLIAIQPYWVFLIIAKTMGWEIDQEKTVEVRKTFPKAVDWNKKSIIYCSKNKQSFNRIPKKYQPLMEKFLGKVIGEFVCDRIVDIPYSQYFVDYYHTMPQDDLEATCLCMGNIDEYLLSKDGFGWHITDLVIYDKPKELSEFNLYKPKKCDSYRNGVCSASYRSDVVLCENLNCILKSEVKRPPQSWCYVVELGV